jgi:3-hydroxyisobutyrate dehydrogenase-like beta-hydroxyacid dehydrogenase
MIETVGILYPGEMGASLAAVLHAGGYRTVTTTVGRSERTSERCGASNIRALPSLAGVIRESQMVISLVPPAAAWELAVECRNWMAERNSAKLFVDANSISPLTAQRIETLFDECGIGFVDASIHGLASQLQQRGTMFLSGSAAGEISPCFKGLARVVVLGGKVGQASMFKMLLGGMSKGIVALFIEMALAGHRAGMLDELLAQYRCFYPGLMEALDRLLPTYPQHAPRRTEELAELASTLRGLEFPPGMLVAAGQMIAHIADLELPKRYPLHDGAAWNVESVVRAICQHSEPEIDTREASAYVSTEAMC